jgi:hypothetical protein
MDGRHEVWRLEAKVVTLPYITPVFLDSWLAASHISSAYHAQPFPPTS